LSIFFDPYNLLNLKEKIGVVFLLSLLPRGTAVACSGRQNDSTRDKLDDASGKSPRCSLVGRQERDMDGGDSPQMAAEGLPE
jgi:hypothetical protein